MGKIHSMRARWLIGCAVALLVVVTPDPAQGAPPNRGAWESRGNVDPRVAIDVAGPRGGRFEIAGAAGATSVRIFGTATDASLAGFAYFAAVMPDSVLCRARGLTMVGALSYPEGDGREGAMLPPTVGSRVVSLG